jgi:nicotinate-nucleotide adenylyltransferase
VLDPKRCKTLIVYGGSFDPPHRGHAVLPMRVADAIGADGVLYVPAGQPPHKPGRALATGEDRVAMLGLALSGAGVDMNRVAISRIELDRPGASYTVDTLERLAAELGEGVELRLLMGGDMMAIFYQWRRPGRIVELAEPVVMVRQPTDRAALLATLPADLDAADRAAWEPRIIEAETTGMVNASSTELRDLLGRGLYEDERVRAAMDEAVIGYVRVRGLYRTRGTNDQ